MGDRNLLFVRLAERATLVASYQFSLRVGERVLEAYGNRDFMHVNAYEMDERVAWETQVSPARLDAWMRWMEGGEQPVTLQ